MVTKKVKLVNNDLIICSILFAITQKLQIIFYLSVSPTVILFEYLSVVSLVVCYC